MVHPNLNAISFCQLYSPYSALAKLAEDIVASGMYHILTVTSDCVFVIDRIVNHGSCLLISQCARCSTLYQNFMR